MNPNMSDTSDTSDKSNMYPMEFEELCKKFYDDKDTWENTLVATDSVELSKNFSDKFFSLEKMYGKDSNKVLKIFLERSDVKSYFEKKILDKNNIDMVFYHGNCFDGFGSAYVVWSYYKKMIKKDHADNLTYFGCKFINQNEILSDKILSTVTDKNVIMCDFSYRLLELIKIIVLSKSFLIIDHHKTAQADLSNIYSFLKIFAMDKSGVGLTWDYFYPNEILPKFLAHIQDRDIWTNSMSDTNDFITYFYQQEMKFDTWDTYNTNDVVDSAILKGSAWIEYQNIIIDRITRKASYIIQKINNPLVRDGANDLKIVVYSNTPDLKSDIGNKLFNKIPFADFSVVWDYDIYRDKTLISLRSTDDRSDVSIIAKIFGGGGHRNASGMAYDGCQPTLKFERIDDYGLLELMLNKEANKVKIDKESTKYVLFNVEKIKQEWLTDILLTLLKKKMSDYPLLVFRSISEDVKYNESNNSIVKIWDYTIVFNEYAKKHGIEKLEYMAAMTKDKHLLFSSEKDFHDIFVNPTIGSDNNDIFDGDNSSDSE